jgi:hypothetical protein
MAIGSLFWLYVALLPLGDLTFTNWLNAFVMFLLTVGYAARAWGILSLRWRQGLWGLSAWVQGGLAMRGVAALMHGIYRLTPITGVCLLWWLFAGIASCWFLLIEDDDRKQPVPADSP